MRTKDGFEVPWSHSNARITGLTRKEVQALKRGQAVDVFCAYGKLTEGQFLAMFGAKRAAGGETVHAQRHRTGKALLEYNVRDYCLGIGQLRLYRIICKARANKWSRDDLITELLAWS